MTLFDLTTAIADSLNRRLPNNHFTAVDCQVPDSASDRWGEIQVGDGRVIRFYCTSYNFDRDTSRLVITGGYPCTKAGDIYAPGEDSPSITFAARRSAEALAADMLRRFWPRYTAVYEQALAWIAEWDARDERVAAYRALLARAGGGQVLLNSQDVRRYGGVDRPGFRARVGSDGRVSLKLEYVDVETACEVLVVVFGGNGEK